MTYPLKAPLVFRLGVGLLAASVPSVALAQPEPTRPPIKAGVVYPEQRQRSQASAEPEPEGQWYGWQTLLGMAGAHALFFTGIALGGETDLAVGLIAAGGIGQVLAPPVVHFANGYWGKGAASLGLTIGIPAAVAGSFLLASAIDCSGGGGFSCGLGYALVGVGLGAIAYVVTLSIDLSVLARHPVDRGRMQSGSRYQLSLMPVPSRDGAAFGLSGQFY